MTRKFDSLTDLFKEYPWRTANKFIPLAKRYGFTDEKEVIKFLKNKAPHDERVPPPKFLPIYSRTTGAYQMDTLIQKKENPILVFVNINTRKAYAYMMANKGAKEVKKALEKFIGEVKDVRALTSDQDSAYLSYEVLTFLKSKSVTYHTTEDNNHNVLGIINRFMRTLRDLNDERDFTETKIQQLIEEYNRSPHSGIGGKSPNDMNETEEQKYVEEKTAESQKNTYDYKPGDHVRIVLDKNKIGKNRSNLSKEAYTIDGSDGKQWTIRSADGSVDNYPGYLLVKCDDRYKIAETLKDGKRGIVEKILSYDEKKDAYKVKYDEGTIDTIPSKNLRETNPLKLSFMERQYWVRRKNVPIKIRQWV